MCCIQKLCHFKQSKHQTNANPQNICRCIENDFLSLMQFIIYPAKNKKKSLSVIAHVQKKHQIRCTCLYLKTVTISFFQNFKKLSFSNMHINIPITSTENSISVFLLKSNIDHHDELKWENALPTSIPIFSAPLHRFIFMHSVRSVSFQ